MPECELCGKEELLFRCSYCNSLFCSEHRLPESHGCPGLIHAKDDARRKIAESFTGVYEYEDDDEDEEIPSTTYQRPPRRVLKRRRKRFSSQEIRHLTIASILVILVGFSMVGYPGGIINAIVQIPSLINSGFFWYPLVMISIFLCSFMLHEMSHKFTAQHYNLWSEFRMTTQGYYLSAIAILFSFPIFGTGIVYTSGSPSTDENGKINMAGPLSNLILSSLLITSFLIIVLLQAGVILFSSTWFLLRLLTYGIILNAMLGLFNMLPFQPFDGGTIYVWNRRIWLLLAVALLSTLIFGFVIAPFLY